MKGNETHLLRILDGSDKRFVVPVYQRSYDWKKQNCIQLYDDVKKIVDGQSANHFFGSIVVAYSGKGSVQEAIIIDGQQRITTVSIMLIALCNYIDDNNLMTVQEHLSQNIKDSFLTDKWQAGQVKLWLKKEDQKIYEALLDKTEKNQYGSRILENYKYFYDIYTKDSISVDDFFNALKKLEIICITLDEYDNAQLIFESLNSTGLELTEGDKVRNFIMMGVPVTKQEEYYNKYWEKIEEHTEKDVSRFIRDYLSLKQNKTPREDEIYYAYKRYYIDSNTDIQKNLEDILYYASIYEKIVTAETGCGDKRIDDCINRMNRLDVTLIRPFQMRVLDLKIKNKISNSDLLYIFQIVESYILRRFICGVPTNSLNKFFVTLDKEISKFNRKYNESDNTYKDLFSYVLISKNGNARFPKDEEFSDALSVVPLYEKSKKYQIYMLDRFENFETIETKDVYEHIEAGEYSIEHIMPQNLTEAWKKDLGVNANEIHADWLHRLANLTLTGYNSKLRDRPFIEKRDAEISGYRSSGLRLNQIIGTKNGWGLEELQERNSLLVKMAKEIWSYPVTTYVPEEQDYESYSLDDESVDYTDRSLSKYIFHSSEEKNVNWTEMITRVIKMLHDNNKSLLYELVRGTKQSEGFKFLYHEASIFRNYSKIDENIFLDTNNSTNTKLIILRKIFNLFNEEPAELIFYLE